VDLPTYLEANYIATSLIKLVWVCCYILVYGIRPVVIRPKKVGELSALRKSKHQSCNRHNVCTATLPDGVSSPVCSHLIPHM
jgi:hypothetical protein